MKIEDINNQSSTSIEIPIPDDAVTRVVSDIDFEKDGKQVCYLKIPHSRNTSAWGRVLIPIIQFKNGTGPTILLTGGVHGDELEGIVSLTKLSQRLKPEQVEGRIIIIPSLNLPAYLSATRVSPLDHYDLNRTFPGQRSGSVTQMIAHYVDRVLIPKADIVLDMHSGGTSLDFAPSVVMHHLSDKDREHETMKALKKHGAPFGLFLKEGDPDGLLDTAVERRGKIFLSTELRGGGTVTNEAVQIADNGLCNLLRHFEIADIRRSKYTKYKQKTTETLLTTNKETCFIGATEEGLFEPLLPLGAKVQKGDPIAQLHFVRNPSRKPKLFRSMHDGVLICKRVPGFASAGDCLAVIGEVEEWRA